ncbi:3'-5' exonuclease [Candidatus Nitrotoga arctica]|uniref:DNA 3'-5' helicase II n=1 Tax=Candidatus Nitrotoga arctica TaxID=453162 RepID=A0ABM8YZX8_9PROT|nr:3'-5' exonuclease [Candidatus Nitrotoga arctica]CAG9933151.1 Exodeoxyribonuclease V beta chain [Candidatus Nitrotoga arctica]
MNVAASFAKELLSPVDADEDGMPIVQPTSAGRHGISPTLVNLPSLDEESMWIISQLKEENRTGTPWKDMAILYRSYYPVGQTFERKLKAAGIPVSSKKEVRFTDDQDTVKLITIHSSKGLEFPIVFIPDIGLMPDENCVSEEEVRLLYVAMTRATSRLMMTSHRNSSFTQKLQLAIGGK